MSLTIKTNNVPRETFCGMLADMFIGEAKAKKLRKQFDTAVISILSVTLCAQNLMLVMIYLAGMVTHQIVSLVEYVSNSMIHPMGK